MLVVLLDHTLHDGIDLCLFFHVLLVSLLSQQIGVVDLPLDVTLVLLELLKLSLVGLALEDIADLFVLEHGDVDRGVLLLHQANHTAGQ